MKFSKLLIFSVFFMSWAFSTTSAAQSVQCNPVTSDVYLCIASNENASNYTWTDIPSDLGSFSNLDETERWSQLFACNLTPGTTLDGQQVQVTRTGKIQVVYFFPPSFPLPISQTTPENSIVCESDDPDAGPPVNVSLPPTPSGNAFQTMCYGNVAEFTATFGPGSGSGDPASFYEMERKFSSGGQWYDFYDGLPSCLPHTSSVNTWFRVRGWNTAGWSNYRTFIASPNCGGNGGGGGGGGPGQEVW